MVWLTQEKIANLFGVKRPAVTKHLRSIFKEGELKENSVSSILEHTARYFDCLGKKDVRDKIKKAP